jgi:hypothetical protein
MCLICEFGDIQHETRYAQERRAAAMLVCLVKLARYKGDRDGHIEDGLIEEGFTRTEIKDLRASALTMMVALHDNGLLDLEPVAVH